jgi:hypothetical protein
MLNWPRGPVGSRWMISCGALFALSLFLLVGRSAIWSMQTSDISVVSATLLHSGQSYAKLFRTAQFPTSSHSVQSPYILQDNTASGWTSMLTPPTASPHPESSPKTYTRTLVIASLKEDDTSWIERELRHEANLQKAVYIVNDNSSEFHVPLNKGHEVMV